MCGVRVDLGSLINHLTVVRRSKLSNHHHDYSGGWAFLTTCDGLPGRENDDVDGAIYTIQ